MTQYFLDAWVSLFQGFDDLQRDLELDRLKRFPGRCYFRVSPVRAGLKFALGNDDLLRAHPHVAPVDSALPQLACVVEFDANTVAVEIFVQLPPAKAGVMRAEVEWHKLNDAAIAPDQEMSRHPRRCICE